MQTQRIIPFVAIAFALLAPARPAQAQIYSWKDNNGVLVLSNAPRGGGQRTTGPQGLATARVAPTLLSVSSSYEPLIREHSLAQGVRADLVRAVIQVESAFNPRAVSPKGAMGLMQLMPATVAQFRVANPFDPAQNIRAGVAYLKELLIRYENREELALAAYNAGPLAVDRHGSRIPPYKETQDYVQRINALRGNTSHAPGFAIYKTIEMVDGQPVIRYTNVKPAAQSYQEVGR